MKSGIFSFPGRIHRELGKPNEDAAVHLICGDHRVVVLCDGASLCSNGQAAASLTANAVAGYLAFRFEQCLMEPEDVLRRELTQVITKVLTNAAEQGEADPGQFACTVLAAAMDRQGRWCMFHLGDGTAIGKLDVSSEWMSMSYPQTCLQSGGTSLTMNGSMFEMLRFYRQIYPASRSLMLTTDGGMDLFASAPSLLNRPERLSAAEFKPEDDCSVAWLMAGMEF